MNSQLCKKCQRAFIITDDDRQYYTRQEVPPPTLCPACRQQRRMVWRNEMNLHARDCDYCHKPIITTYQSNAPYTVYCADCWFGAKWDPYQYGRDFDFSRPFFEQFDELLHDVPHLGVYALNCENSDFNQSASYLKDCYMLSSSNRDEQCYYGNYVNDCKNSIDNLMLTKSELCYECVECENCFSCFYCKNSQNCSVSYFLQNCVGCTDCFGCVNLVRKQYCWFNEQLTKEEYEQRLAKIKLTDLQVIAELKQRLRELALQHPNKYLIGTDNEQVTGNSVFHSKNSQYCFDVSEVDNCKYCYWLHQAKECMDVFSWGFPAELCYECMSTGDQAYHNRFCVIAIGSQELTYCAMCKSSKYLFGCASVLNGQYAILNKTYSEPEYHQLMAKIISHMSDTGEWGEFFPITMTTYPYNETTAYNYFPLTQAEVKTEGMSWDAPELQSSSSQQSEVSTCQHCQRPFKYIPQEIEFYEKHGLARPQCCFLCRHQARLDQRNPRDLWKRQCMCQELEHDHADQVCPVEFKTSYAPNQPDIVYCDACYQKTVF